jgi:hypothetical protein
MLLSLMIVKKNDLFEDYSQKIAAAGFAQLEIVEIPELIFVENKVGSYLRSRILV